MTFCDKSVLSSVAAGRIQLHWSILVAASLGCALLDAHWAKINFKILVCHFETEAKLQLIIF